ncbi:O-antigen ligase family protein [Pseudomonas cremoricolorata]|uniref:Polymerase n=1 Tax=Pseudomonas cremoricolorata TaxID=157783 RepID=A0A089WNE7_9PSED|nr:O-antigen ligase family protein [Pseudomonas cremoricolorata]AIR90820.1 polymerase [Pseudomonas cremoricolorata]
MILPLSLLSLLGLLSLGLLASPWPYLAPGAVLGLAGLLALYRKPAWGLLAIIALVPFEGVFKDSELTGAKLIGASLAVIVLLQLAVGQLSGERLRSNQWRLLLPLLALYGLSLWLSDDSGVSLGHLRMMAVGFVLFAITLLVGRELNLTLLCQAISVSVAITCALAVFSARFQELGRARGLLDDANVFAMLIAVAVPLALWALLNSRRWLLRLLWLTCLGLLLVGMTKTESRSGLVVLLISLGIAVVHYRAWFKRIRPRHLGFVMLGLALLLPAVAMVMPAKYVERIESLVLLKSGASGNKDDSLGRRTSYLVVGSRLIRDNPMLGAGPGTFPLHYATTGYANRFAPNAKASNLYRQAHNTYLELFSELGIPAGLLFCAMIALALHNLWQARGLWLAQGDQGRADLLTHLSMSMLAIGLFLMFLSAPNHKYLWIMLALSSVLRLQAEQAMTRWRTRAPSQEAAPWSS